MTASPSSAPAGTILLIGASRGLGHAMAGELLRKGWHVVGTVRGHARTLLHDLADEFAGRVEIESLEQLVPEGGLIGAMSSEQGSIANNMAGMLELYRGTKAALNMFMRSFAARHAGSSRALALMVPGWVRTELGGSEAPLSIEDSVPSLVNVLLAKRARPGLEYLDYLGRTVPW